MDDENIYSTKHLQDQKEHQAKYWTKQKKKTVDIEQNNKKYPKVSVKVKQQNQKYIFRGRNKTEKKEYFVLYEKVPMIYP